MLDHDHVCAAGFGWARRGAQHQWAQRSANRCNVDRHRRHDRDEVHILDQRYRAGDNYAITHGDILCEQHPSESHGGPECGCDVFELRRRQRGDEFDCVQRALVTSNKTVSATFTAPQYTLTTTVSGPGTVTQSPTGTSFASGTAITLTTVPNTGATFTSWSGVQRQHQHGLRVQYFGEHVGDGDVFKSTGGDDAGSIANRRGGQLVYLPAERDRILDGAYVHRKRLDTGRLVHDQRHDAGSDDGSANCGERASSGGVGRTCDWRRKRASRRKRWQRSGSRVRCSGC